VRQYTRDGEFLRRSPGWLSDGSADGSDGVSSSVSVSNSVSNTDSDGGTDGGSNGGSNGDSAGSSAGVMLRLIDHQHFKGDQVALMIEPGGWAAGLGRKWAAEVVWAGGEASNLNTGQAGQTTS
jgi:hypothetical protein